MDDPATQQTAAGLLLAGRFRLLGMVGEGGMGTVFRAHDTELEELIALKVLRRSVLAQPNALARFRQEVKLARRVAHPGVARIYDLGRDGEDRFLTMEFIDGEPLGVRLGRQGPMPVASTVAVLRAVAQALQAIHQAGVIHRDLKPDNVLVDRAGRIVVTDFGVARPLDDTERLAQTQGAIVGTPRYMAPEQFSGEDPVDARADLFALGVMAFEMLTGEAPWPGKTPLALLMARVSHPARRVAECRSDVPPSLEALVSRLLATAPADRPADAAAVLAALGEAPTGAPAPTLAEPPPERGKTVAVLPVRAAAPIQHLADGVAEALTDGLSMTKGLRVVAHARSAAEAHRTPEPRALGQLLGAQVLVGASLDALGDGYVLRVRLTAAADGIQFWAQRFQGPLSALFELAERATAAVADALVVEARPSLTNPLIDPEALDLFLRGRAAYRRFWGPAVDQAVALMTQARQKATGHPVIAGGLALATARQVVLGRGDAAGASAVRALATEALERLPGQAQAHLALATLALNSGDPAQAGRGVGAALRAAPGDPEVLELAGRLRASVGPLPHALHLLDVSERLDPGQLPTRVSRARVRALLGDWAGASAELDEHTTDPNRRAYLDATRTRQRGWCRDLAGALRIQAARRADGLPTLNVVEMVVHVLTQGQVLASHLRGMADFIQRDGATPRVKAFYQQLFAEQHLLAQQPEPALEAVTRSVAHGLFDEAWMEHCPLLAPLRGEPAFQALHRTVSQRAATARASLDQD